MKYFIFLIGLLCLYVPNIAATTYDNVIIFGDSLTDAGDDQTPSEQDKDADTGNNYWVKSVGKTGAPITSLNPTSNTHPMWSNIFVEQFPDITNHRLLEPSRKIQSLQLNPYTDNIDYAYASAESANWYDNDDTGPHVFTPENPNCTKPGLMAPGNACVPGMRMQLTHYLENVNNKPNPKTLFIIWVGGNDMINDIDKLIYLYEKTGIDKQTLYKNSLAFANDEKSIRSNNNSIHFSYPVYNIHKVVEELEQHGVSPQQIYVANLPDLSSAPAAKALTKNNKILLSILHLMTNLYNFNLYIALTTDSKLHFQKSHLISTYDFQEKIFKHPEQYGFTNIEDSCVTNKADPICQGYFFFNTLHPTAPSGKLIANNFIQEIQASHPNT